MTLAKLALVGLLSGFVDAIAGGAGPGLRQRPPSFAAVDAGCAKSI
jgi:hypothetical protein